VNKSTGKYTQERINGRRNAVAGDVSDQSSVAPTPQGTGAP